MTKQNTILPILNAFYMQKGAFDVFQVIDLDNEEKTVTIEKVLTSPLYDNIDAFMSQAFDTHGHQAVECLEAIRVALDKLPEDWKVAKGLKLQLNYDLFAANGFKNLHCQTVAEAMEKAYQSMDEQNIKRMVDMGIMGFGGPMFGEGQPQH